MDIRSSCPIVYCFVPVLSFPSVVRSLPSLYAGSKLQNIPAVDAQQCLILRPWSVIGRQYNGGGFYNFRRQIVLLLAFNKQRHRYLPVCHSTLVCFFPQCTVSLLAITSIGRVPGCSLFRKFACCLSHCQADMSVIISGSIIDACDLPLNWMHALLA